MRIVTSRKRSGHSKRLVNKFKMSQDACVDYGFIKSKMTLLARIVTMGFDSGDFERNRYTLKQFVKIPRIANPTSK